MKVRYKKEEDSTAETWADEDTKSNDITLKKGDIFNTGFWGFRDKMLSIESVLTDKGEWICDTDSVAFSEDFEVIEGEEKII